MDRNFCKLRATRKISILELDGEFSTPVLVFGVNSWANLPYPESLKSPQIRDTSGGNVNNADIVLVVEHGRYSTQSDMFPEWLGGLTMLLESFH